MPNLGLGTFLRSLGFGALFGAGVAGIVYSLLPTAFPGASSIDNLLLVGGLAGGGLHRAVDVYVIGGILRPMTSFVQYYSKLGQLIWLTRQGVIGSREAREIQLQITTKYFIDDGLD